MGGMTTPEPGKTGSAVAPMCSACSKRPGTLRWGNSLSISHGWADQRCGVCVYRAQFGHAVARSVLIPSLAAKLIWAWVRRS